MNQEKQYTSTSNKLFNHMGVLSNIRYNKQWRPINLQIAPTEKCNLNCDFCSVKNRGNEQLGFLDICNTVNEFHKMGLKSVEITGGGEPTLYPKINELIEFCKELKLDIGLITNGVQLSKLNLSSLNSLIWLRVSLNGLDYKVKSEIPKNFQGTLGFSYVWNEKSSVKTLRTLNSMQKKHKAEYIRIVPNCLDIKEQTVLKKQINRIIDKNPQYKHMFVQTKPYSVYPNCYIGGLKPFLYTDGYIYQCSAVALYERKFSPKWRICHMSEIVKAWDCYQGIDNSMCEKGKCFYSEQNKLLHELQMVNKHGKFI